MDSSPRQENGRACPEDKLRLFAASGNVPPSKRKMEMVLESFLVAFPTPEERNPGEFDH
jgi:hypothetical protein